MGFSVNDLNNKPIGSVVRIYASLKFYIISSTVMIKTKVLKKSVNLIITIITLFRHSYLLKAFTRW